VNLAKLNVNTPIYSHTGSLLLRVNCAKVVTQSCRCCCTTNLL